jgi:hypothetical protein
MLKYDLIHLHHTVPSVHRLLFVCLLSSLFFGVDIASREFIAMIYPDPTVYVHSGSYRIRTYV